MQALERRYADLPMQQYGVNLGPLELSNVVATETTFTVANPIVSPT
jgi:hypothetical protein